MTLSREELAAFADGELDPARAAEVAIKVAADPDLARQVDEHRALKQMLSSHFAPIAAEQVPDRLSALLNSGEGKGQGGGAVIDLGAVRAERSSRRLPRWSWLAGPALAASLALLLLSPPHSGSNKAYADAQLAAALDTQLSSEPRTADRPQILLSFTRSGGEFCRAWTARAGSGIACRDEKGWRIERTGPGTASDDTAYRQAGTSLEEMMAAAQDMAGEGALDPAQEAAARQRGWR